MKTFLEDWNIAESHPRWNEAELALPPIQSVTSYDDGNPDGWYGILKEGDRYQVFYFNAGEAIAADMTPVSSVFGAFSHAEIWYRTHREKKYLDRMHAQAAMPAEVEINLNHDPHEE